ncbi:YDG domain-containing protein [Novosphingobium sp. PhB165]|uniref:YDG domain-containing protein n=1 Tax=Novosphingobium sp. PhB165 TaxID=2485105 RepID=UPI001404296B|nr:YDG domain-containing protein [Novosphingobium sp. PhB165]
MAVPLLLSLATPCLAQTAPLPTGGVFAGGSGTIATSGSTMTITQGSARAVIDWKDFSIGADRTVQINNAAGATLNRVMGGQLSQIDGTLSATGSVYLMNPAGMIVGPGGKVLTGGSFVGTTRQIDPGQFMAGGAVRAAGNSPGGIDNQGTISAENGSVVLIARSVTNSGLISAAQGRVTLAAADDVLLATTDGKADGIYVSYGAGGGDVTQTGRIEAAAVALKAANGNIFALAGNRDGLVKATGTATIDGQLWLTAPSGTVDVGGTLSATRADGSGGTVGVNGAQVQLAGSADIRATGTGGGEVLVGTSGYASGANIAQSTTIADGARITAGGPQGGGLIETSGHSFSVGAATVSAGTGGNWLIDPDDLVIDATAASTIVGTLNTGTNVTQQTSASGTGGLGDITVAAPIVWTGTGTLTLDAYRDVVVGQMISGVGELEIDAGRNVTVNAPISVGQTLFSLPGTLTLAAGSSITTNGYIGLETGTFVNNAGAGALTSRTADWFVASNDPANDTDGGLIPDYYSYAYDGLTAFPAPGNGRFYRVTPSVSFTLGPVVKDYDGTTLATLNDSNTTVTGIINNDVWTLDGAYADKNAGTGIAVTASNFQATHNGIPVYNYAVTTPSVTDTVGTINRVALTAAIVGTPTKTYNATTAVSLTAANFALTGVVTGETINVSNAATAAYDSPNAGARTVNATFTTPNFSAGSGTSLSNYILPTIATGAGLINPASLLVSGIVAQDKVYDSTTNAVLNTTGASVFGVVGSDDVTLDFAGATGVFATKNVGTAIPVTATGITLSGSSAGNYVVSQPSGLSADITRASLVVTGITANDKIYDGTFFADVNTSGLQISGLYSRDVVVPISTPGAQITFAQKDVGQGIPVTISGIVLSGADAGNYNLSFSSSLTAAITPRPLTLTGNGMPTKIYDGTTNAVVDSSQVALGNVVAGESISLSQASGLNYASKNVGIWDIAVALNPSDYVAGPNTLLSNYILPTTGAIQGEITPAPLTIVIVGNPTKTYDGNANASLGPTNFFVDGFVTGEGASINQTQGQYASANAGIWTVSANLDASNFDPNANTLMSNYIIPSPVTGLGTIVRRNLGPGVINADITGNPTKVYDGNTVATLTPADYTLSGFIAGEGATITQTVGEYGSKDAGLRTVIAQLAPTDFIADSGTNLDNYTLPTEATGIGTILRAPLTATIIGNPTRVYNGTTRIGLNPTDYEISGLITGESMTITGAATGEFDSPNAGSRVITAALPSSAAFTAGANTLLTNYVLPVEAAGPGTITPAPLVILGMTAQNKVYDQTTLAQLAGTPTLFGLVSGDDVTLDPSASTGNFATPNVGNGIAVTVSGYTVTGASIGNYQLFQPQGLTANITPRGLTIANLLANDKFYDGTTAATLSGTATLQGVLSGDDVVLSGSGSSAAFRQSNVGTNLRVDVGGYAISGGQAGNYTLAQPSGLTADINPLALTGSIIGNPTKTYDGTTEVSLTAANYALSGFIAGEGGSVGQSAGAAYDSPDAGARTVTATLAVSDFTANAGTLLSNYVLPTSISGPGTITQAQLAAIIVGNPTKIYNANTVATLTSANYSLSGFVGGESADVTQTVGTYDSKNVGSRVVTASLGAGDFAAGSGTNLANYLLPTSASGAGTITQATLQVIGITAQNKVYDGTTQATLDSSGGSLSGVFAGDTVNLVSGGASGQFATKNVGTAIPVTATGYTTSGVDAPNYIVLQPVGLAADITEATIRLASVTKVYDANTLVPTVDSAYALSGVVAGDSVGVTASGITGNYDTKNVGTGKLVTLSGVVLNGADAGNYSIATSVTDAAIGTITPATLNVTGVLAQDKIYNQSSVASLNTTGAGLSGVLGTDDVRLDNVNNTGTFIDGAGNATANVGLWNVLTSGYTVTGVDAGNYNLVQPQGLSAQITPLEIFLTSVTKVYDGTVTLPGASTGYTFSGVLGGDTVIADTSGVTGQYNDSANVGTGKPVTVNNLGLTGASAGNYSISSSVTGNIGTITQAQLFAAIIGNPTKTYDGNNSALLGSTNYSLTGFASGEGATITQTAGTYDTVNQGSRIVTALLGAGDFTPTGATLLSNYALPTSATGAGTIDQRVLTISGVTAQNKVYDGNTNATLNSGSAVLVNVVSGDTVALDSSAASGTFATKNVGTNIPVTAAGYALLNNPFDNYVVAQPTGLSADITQALIELTKVTKVYDSTTDLPMASTAYTLNGVVSGDDVSVNTAGITGSYADKNVAPAINVTLTGLTLAGIDASNYSISGAVTAQPIGEITPATLNVAIIGNPTKVYNGNTAATLASGNFLITGFAGTEGATINQTVGTYDSANVGARTITAALTQANYDPNSGTLLSNYVLATSATGAGTITPAQLSAAIINNPTKTYDGNINATLNAGNYQLTGFVAGQSATVTQTFGTYASANAGNWLVTAALGSGDFTAGSGTLLSNYILPTSAQGLGTIDQAVLTAAIIGNPTKTYDGNTVATLTGGNYQLTGFVTGEGASVTQTVGAYDSANAGPRTVTASLAGGDFTANSGTLLTNYVLPTTASGAGTIGQATLSAVIINNPTKVYDGNTAATLTSGNYQLTGFIGSESASVTQTAGLYDSANAGPRTVTASLGGGDFTAGSGTLLSNYVLPTSASGAGTITQALLTAAIVGTPTKSYDGTTAALLNSTNFALSGFVAGEGASVTQTVGTYDSPNAGARTVTASLAATDFTATGSTLLSNYILPTTASGAGVINRAVLVASIVGVPTKTYDATTAITLTPANYSLTGFAAGEGATITRTDGFFASPDAGFRQITATLGASDFAPDSGTLLSNYLLPSTATGFGLIERAVLTASIIGNPTKVYDGTTAATLTSANYSLTGFVAGQGATITETAGTYDSANAGPRTVSVTFGSPDFVADSGTLLTNYVLPLDATGAGTITQATLLAAIVGNPTKTYDGNANAILTSANYTLTGFIAGEGATVTQTAGLYDGPNAGAHSVTASLAGGDFAANGGTLLSNYILPTSATGAGTITQAILTAAIIGNPTKTYDGTTDATLSSANYMLTGFVAGEGASVTQTFGTYDSPNAGPRIVTAALGSIDFAADSGTLLSNYILPTSASGAGTINPRPINGRAIDGAIIGNPTKVYDGNTIATLTPANYDLTGFVGSDGAIVTQTVGRYASKDAGIHLITADLDPSDFTPTGTTLLSNYLLPTTVFGPGTITQATLLAVIIGNPTKTYDGTTAAMLTSANYSLTGFVSGEGASVTQTSGTYQSRDAGLRLVTASLGSADFAANSGTLLSNYVLPTSAAGLGTITQAILTASIIGNPTKTYDGNANATLTSANYSLTGFAVGEGASVTQAAGLYDSANAGSRTVTASLGGADFSANSGTLLTNYILPTSATGAGTITQAALLAAIIGNPTKTYNGNANALLTSANYSLTGFIAGEGATITQTAGLYDSANAGSRTVTASLGAGDFNANSGTLLSNYALPTSASGAGTIDQAVLSITVVGDPTKAYDGTTSATLTDANYSLTGFAPGEGATVNQTAGLYDGANAGPHTVSTSLDAGDFTADSGTLLSNYVLPTSASGAGTISRAVLMAAIIGNPTKTYDGNKTIALTSANYSLTGFATGEGAIITQPVGTYDSANAGARIVTAGLATGDFTANGGTLLSNYVLPTSASGAGTIDRAILMAAIIGDPTKTYDGNSNVTLTSANYSLTGFVAGEGARITETSGLYDGPNAGAHTETAALDSSDYTANSGTLLSNYVLPTSASGDGTINRADLTVAITGNPTKQRDGNTNATLKPGDYTITGFVAGDGASITQTQGTYASPEPGQHLVTAALSPSDYLANQGTLLANYNLPDVATGPGTILYAYPCASVVLCLPDLPDLQAKFWGGLFGRFYIVYPSIFPRYQGLTQGMAAMPSILQPGGIDQTATDWTIRKRTAVVNSSDQILNRGGGSVQIQIHYDTPSPAIGLGGGQ